MWISFLKSNAWLFATYWHVIIADATTNRAHWLHFYTTELWCHHATSFGSWIINSLNSVDDGRSARSAHFTLTFSIITNHTNSLYDTTFIIINFRIICYIISYYIGVIALAVLYSGYFTLIVIYHFRIKTTLWTSSVVILIWTKTFFNFISFYFLHAYF